MKPVRLFSVSLLCALFAGQPLIAGEASTPESNGVQITELPDRLRIEINGQLFTEYLFKDVPRPCYFPLIGPGGAAMTRNFPLKEGANEEQDHRHHRSLWIAHYSVNGHDTWTENTGSIVHTGFDEIRSGDAMGVIRSRNNWLAKDGSLLCTDERTFRIHNRPNNERLFDIEVTLRASQGEVTFGDNKDGLMAIRLAETMRLKPNRFNTDKPAGRIINSEGDLDAAAWGKRAKWVDYSGPVDGKTLGVAIFDHPTNPRHPTWWHVRDYGLFAANPFGKHHFENLRDPTAGNLVVPAGESITFRYRFYIHEGDDQQGKVAERYQQFVSGN
jgi:hypothetical protein